MAPHPVATLSRDRVVFAWHARAPHFAPPIFQDREVEAIAARRAPDPPRQGDTPARPARMPIVVPLAIRAHQSISFQRNFVRLAAPRPQARMLRGRQWPDRRGGNIVRRAPEPYGSQMTLYPNGERGRLVPLAGMP